MSSASADSEIAANLSKTYALSAAYLDSFNAATTVASVTSARLTLSNVRIETVEESEALKRLPSRDKHCQDNIRLRRQEGNNDITVLTSALFADATYELSFSGTLTAGARLQALDDIAASMNLERKGESNSLLAGEGLIWGVRDDPFLLLDPENPGTTGATPGERDVLRAGAQAAQFIPMDDAISYAVPIEPQQYTNDCWAACITMLSNWKRGESAKAKEVVASLGDPWSIYYETDTGLPAGDQSLLFDAVGLESEAPQNFTIKAYRQLLKEHGPLLIITGDLASSHARLVASWAGDGSPAGTFLELIDPLSGSSSWLSMEEFILGQYETEAHIVNAIDRGRPEGDQLTLLRDQVVHWP